MKIAITFFIVLSATLFTKVQANDVESDKGSITGKVIESELQSPVEYANIAVYTKADSVLVTGTITDTNGVYQIDKVPEGEYYLVVDFIGYEPIIIQDIEVDKKTKTLDAGTITIRPDVEMLGAVDVVGEKKAMLTKVDKKVFNVDKNLSATGGTAVDALKISPSITIDQEGNVLLRGSSNFKVLVNGKPTALKSNEALKQIPSGRIDNIEIITNPSAKYDSEGTAGIINIITKKGMGVGTSALFNASAGTGDKYNADMNLNYSNDKLNIVVGANWKDRKEFYNMDELIRTTTADGAQTNEIDFYREQFDKDFGGNLSVDYNFNNRNSISYSADVGYNNLYINANFKYDETHEGSPEHNYVFEDINTKLLANYFTNNFSYSLDLADNSNLVSSLFYSKINYFFDNYQKRFNTIADFSNSGIEPYYSMQFENENFSKELKASTDYTLKLKDDAKFEAGAQYHTYNRYIDLDAELLNTETNVWEADEVFTNEFDFDEQIYSAYVNYNNNLFNFDFNVGLRLEYTNRLIESFTIDEQYRYEKINYFPTFSLSRSLDKKRQLYLNFSRRIDRPDEYFLNPFPDISNDVQRAYGNPLLRPNLTSSYELGFKQHLAKGVLSSQLYYRSTNDAFTQVISSDEDGIMNLTFDNISDDREYGIENTLSIQANSWWSLNASLNVQGQSARININGEKYNRSAATFDMRLINMISLGKNTKAQIMAFYFHDRLANSIGNVERFYWVEASVQHSMLNNRLNFTLQAKDIFNTNQLKFDIDRSDYRFYVHRKPEYPLISISVSYKLNNYIASSNSVKTKLKM